MTENLQKNAGILLGEVLGISSSLVFPWQSRLLDSFLAGNLPAALDIPTGLGKTSVMAIWLVARAAGAPVPRRLVYVVDRRAVVDQATEFAEQLREFVKQNPETKEKLGLAGDLPISTLRGQFVDNREWLDDPSSPAIIVGTVDMIGSRLLFGGYGVSSKMRPYHAGFLGADSLVVLDEAHLVQPFERLLEQVAKGEDSDRRPLRPSGELDALIPRFQCMSLSATGRERNSAEVFQLNEDDRKHEVVKRRLTAKKRLVVRPAVADKGLAENLAQEVWGLSGEGRKPGRYIVFCNSRKCAQDVQVALEAFKKKSGQVIDTELFVGARRVYERARLANWLRERGFMAEAKMKLEIPVFVVATSAGEVGVDLDADHAVCDLVAWERMVQRFGRVNRRGDGAAEIVVVPQEPGDPEKDPNGKFRPHLLALIEALPRTEDGEGASVSPEGLLSLRDSQELRRRIELASTPAPLHPPLTRALVESWSMTSLDDHTGRPEVAPWIRGWQEHEKSQTTVVWRKYLPVKDDGTLLAERELAAYRNAAPPHLAEKLETDTWRVFDWLKKRAESLTSEMPEDKDVARPNRPLRVESVVAVILDLEIGKPRVIKGSELLDRESRGRLERMLEGALLIVDSKFGGLENGLLADRREGLVSDISEIDLSSDVPEERNERVIPFRVHYVPSGSERETPKGWRVEAEIPVAGDEDKVTASLVIESLIDQAAEMEEARSVAKDNQSLVEHEEWAESEARAIAARLTLPAQYAEMLAVAARLHDEGKKVDRWQRAFNAPSSGGPYAKTVGRPRFSILNGYRHELGSLPYAERDARVLALSPDLRRLCLRLIVAHHGYARPVIRIEGGVEPPTRLRKRAQAVALEFSALEKQWGPWGLAWWEALLRAADQRASRRLDRQAQEGGANG